MKRLFSLILTIVCLSSYAQIDPIELESTTIVVESVAQDLEIPWDMVWGPDNKIWFSERIGNIKRLDPETGEVELLYYESDCDPFEEENSGMHAFSLHPEFPIIPYLYAHYSNTLFTSKLVRYTFDINTNSITSAVELLQFGANSSHNGSRIVWDGNESFFFCLGDAYTSLSFPQNADALNGKVLRIGMNGDIPSDNPTPGSYVYSLGHRNPQGLVLGPNGLLYSSEHGTAVDDEINIIYPNANYGWPYALGPCDVFNAEELEFCMAFNVEEPIWWWNPTQAPCGIEFYDHEAIPEWNNSLLVGFLKEAQFKQLVLTEDGLEVLEEIEYLDNVLGRIRDILMAPDGSVYMCTSNREITGFPYVQPEDDQIYRFYNPDYTFIEEAEDDDLGSRMFPNPAQAYTNITFADSNRKTIEVFDSSGRRVHSTESFNQNFFQLNTSNWEGVYLVRVTFESGDFKNHLLVVGN